MWPSEKGHLYTCCFVHCKPRKWNKGCKPLQIWCEKYDACDLYGSFIREAKVTCPLYDGFIFDSCPHQFLWHLLSALQVEWHCCFGWSTLGRLPSLTIAHLLLRFSISWGWHYIMPQYAALVPLLLFPLFPALYSLPPFFSSLHCTRSDPVTHRRNDKAAYLSESVSGGGCQSIPSMYRKIFCNRHPSLFLWGFKNITTFRYHLEINSWIWDNQSRVVWRMNVMLLT